MRNFLSIVISIVQFVTSLLYIGTFRDMIIQAEGEATFGETIFPLILMTIFVLIILIPLGLASCAVRHFEIAVYDPILWMFIALEVVLSPLALGRMVVAEFVRIFKFRKVRANFKCCPLDIPLKNANFFHGATQYLFGFYIDPHMTPVYKKPIDAEKIKNVLISIFGLLPLTFVHSWLALRFILCFFNLTFGIFWILPIFFGITVLSLAICYIRGHRTLSLSYDPSFKFENAFGKTKKITASEDDTYHDANDETIIENGSGYSSTLWTHIKGGYHWVTRPIVILTTFLSPITFICQLIGVIFAFISKPYKNHIDSYFGKMEYDDLRFPKLQKVLHLLFGFVID